MRCYYFRICSFGPQQRSVEIVCRNEEKWRKGKWVISCILSTCAGITALELGYQLHAQLVKVGLRSGWYVGNALLSMYCKCGNLDEANAIFEEISDNDIVSWNTTIAGYARHGFGNESSKSF